MKEENFRNIKTILYYTPFHSSQDFGFGFGRDPFIKNGCLVKNCFATNNRKLLSNHKYLYLHIIVKLYYTSNCVFMYSGTMYEFHNSTDTLKF